MFFNGPGLSFKEFSTHLIYVLTKLEKVYQLSRNATTTAIQSQPQIFKHSPKI